MSIDIKLGFRVKYKMKNFKSYFLFGHAAFRYLC